MVPDAMSSGSKTVVETSRMFIYDIRSSQQVRAMVFEETLVGDKRPVYHIPNIAAGASKFIKVVDNFF